MAKKQTQEKFLKYIHLLDELYFIKGKSEEMKLSSEQIRKLRFVKQDMMGNYNFVENYKMQLGQHGNEIVILILDDKK